MRSRLLVGIALCGVVACVVAGVTLGAFGCAAVSCVTIIILCVSSLTAGVDGAAEVGGTSQDAPDASDIKTPQNDVDLEPEPATTEAYGADEGAHTDADAVTPHEATKMPLLTPQDVEAVHETSANPHEDAP